MTRASLVVSTVQGPRVDFGYDAANRLTGLTRQVPGASTDSITSSLGYDNANRLTGITHTHNGPGGGTQLADYGYGYNAASELTSYTGPEGSLNYTYDTTSQLTGASGARAESYSYDLNGNRTMTGYQTGTNNRLLSDGAFDYTFDAEGNMLTRTRISDGQKTGKKRGRRKECHAPMR